MKIGSNFKASTIPIYQGYKEVPESIKLIQTYLPSIPKRYPGQKLINPLLTLKNRIKGIEGYYTFERVFKPNKSWICGTGYAGQLYVEGIGYAGQIKREKAKLTSKLLIHKNCKKIIVRSKAVRESLKMFDYKRFKDKVEVMYPSIVDSDFERRRFNKKTINLLFVTKGWIEASGINKFHAKGGKEVLKAFEILMKNYDLELKMVGSFTEDVLKKYSRYQNIKFIKDMETPEYLYNTLYPEADIYVMPSSIDAFGFVFLEAMNYGLPIVASRSFAIPEIVEDGRGGLLIEPEFTQFNKDYIIDKSTYPKYKEYHKKIRETEVPQLIEKISILIEDTSMRRSMSCFNRKLVSDGKFSIKRSRSQLKRIFEEIM